MRGLKYAIKSAMLVGMALALSTNPALASGENKAENDKPKVEMIKVEKNKVEKAMLQEKKVEEELVMKQKANSDAGVLRINLFLDEGILGIEDILGIEE